MLKRARYKKEGEQKGKISTFIGAGNFVHIMRERKRERQNSEIDSRIVIIKAGLLRNEKI